MIKRCIAKRLVGYNYCEAKQKWREFCAVETRVPIYFKDWFWDAACDDIDDWWVVLKYSKNGEIIAAFPFKYTIRKGLLFIESAWQVASAGLWYIDTNSSNKTKRLSHLENIVDYVIDRLPYYDRFQIIFNSSLWTWQPFYWHGFLASPVYTMIIESNTDDIMKRITSSRRNVVTREGNYRIEKNNISIEQAFSFIKDCYEEKQEKLNYSKDKFLRLLKAINCHGALEILTLYKDDVLVACNILFEDYKRNYNHFIAHDNNEAFAGSKIIYESINMTLHQGKTFDFEGTMIHGNCRFYSSYNPHWEEQYLITDYSRKYRIINSARNLLGLFGN